MARNLRCNLPESERAKVLSWFEEQTYLDVAEESQMSACFPQYLFYETWGTKNYRECHCTSCGDNGDFSFYADEIPAFFKKKHGDVINCPRCDTDVELVSLGKMRNLGSLNNAELRFSIFRPAPDGGLLVVSGWGTKYYTWGDLSPTVHFKEKERQYFAPGIRQRWKRVWEYDGLCGSGYAHPVGWQECAYMAEPFSACVFVVRAFCYVGRFCMALKAYRPCAHPGCRALVRSGYCDKHRPSDRSRRSADAADWHCWYELPIWRTDLRPAQLLREPFCRECAARARRENRPELLRVPATDVDHVKPHRGIWSRFIDRTNLQSLCHSCHSRKTMAEMAENKRPQFG